MLGIPKTSNYFILFSEFTSILNLIIILVVCIFYSILLWKVLTFFDIYIFKIFFLIFWILSSEKNIFVQMLINNIELNESFFTNR